MLASAPKETHQNQVTFQLTASENCFFISLYFLFAMKQLWRGFFTPSSGASNLRACGGVRRGVVECIRLPTREVRARQPTPQRLINCIWFWTFWFGWWWSGLRRRILHISNAPSRRFASSHRQFFFPLPLLLSTLLVEFCWPARLCTQRIDFKFAKRASMASR